MSGGTAVDGSRPVGVRFSALGPSMVAEPVEEMDGKSEQSRLARDGWFCKEDTRGNGERGSV